MRRESGQSSKASGRVDLTSYLSLEGCKHGEDYQRMFHRESSRMESGNIGWC